MNNYSISEIRCFSDEELAEKINELDHWEEDLLKELIERADLQEEWDAADGATFEDVVYKAAEILGVVID